jgi:hypothetical protein
MEKGRERRKQTKEKREWEMEERYKERKTKQTEEKSGFWRFWRRLRMTMFFGSQRRVGWSVMSTLSVDVNTVCIFSLEDHQTCAASCWWVIKSNYRLTAPLSGISHMTALPQQVTGKQPKQHLFTCVFIYL